MNHAKLRFCFQEQGKRIDAENLTLPL